MNLDSDLSHDTCAENAGSQSQIVSLGQRPANCVGQYVLEGEVLSSDDSITVSIAAHPLKVETQVGAAPAGLSISEIAEQYQPDPILRRYGVAFINGNYVPHKHWHLVRPKAGTHLSIRLLPLGGGGNNKIFRTLLTIAVIVASIAIPAALPAALTSMTVAGSLTVGGLISAGILVAGGLLINMIAPMPKPKLRGSGSIETDTPTEFIAGARNRFNPFGVVPDVMGEFRMVPPYGANPFTETVGGDQYVRMLFTYGYGPVTVRDRKIGETLLTAFSDVETEFRRGYHSTMLTNKGNWSAAGGTYPATAVFGDKYTISVAGTIDGVAYVVGDTIIFNGLATVSDSDAWDKNHDKPFTLYPRDIFQDDYSILLEASAGWIARTARADGDELSIDIAFLSGLVQFDDQANKSNYTVTVEVNYRLTGTVDPWLDPGTITSTAKQTNALIKGLRWTVPTRGQYDIRLRRTTADTDSSQVLDDVTWIAVRTITKREPVNMDGVAGEVLRIRATDQLKGVVDEYNAVVKSIAKDYDTGSGTWIMQPTANPASLARKVFQSYANKARLEDSRMHLDSFESFHDYCRINGFEYNNILDRASSVNEILNSIFAVGRASKVIIDNKWGVVFEEAQTVPVQHITPRNSWGFEGKRLYVETPHAWRIPFFNRDADWALDELIVYDDGYGATSSGGLTAATEFLELDFEGITDVDHLWKMGRFHFAQAQLRLDRYKVWMDMEYIVARRGSLVLLTHDVISTGLGWGRIAELGLDDGGDVVQIVLDEAVEMELGQLYAISVRTPDEISLVLELVTTPGTNTTVTLAQTLPIANAPDEGSLVTFGLLGNISLECIVASISPGGNNSAQLELYDAAPAVHDADTGEIPPYTSAISIPAGVSYPAVIAIRSDEDVLIVNPDGSWIQQIQVTLGFTGRSPTQVAGIQARYRPEGSEGAFNVVDAPANASDILLTGVTPEETYEFQVRYLFANSGGDWGPLIAHTVIGPKNPPIEPVNLRLTGDMLYWDYPVPPRDIWGFKIRYQRGDSDYWFTATGLHPSTWADSPFDISSAPSGTITLLVKAVDVAGNESTIPASLLVTRTGVELDYILDSDDYAAGGFPGTITNGTVVGTDLEAGGTTLFWTGDLNSKFWSSTITDLFWSSNFLPMTYEFTYQVPSTVIPTDFLVIDADITADSWTLRYNNPVQYKSVAFNNDSTVWHYALDGAVDGPTGMIFFSFRLKELDKEHWFWKAGGNNIDLRVDGDTNRLQIQVRGASSSGTFTTSSTPFTDTETWHNVMISWDTDFPENQKIIQIWDGDEDITDKSYQQNDGWPAFDVNYTVVAQGLGSATVASEPNAEVARYVMWINERLDLTVESNRRKFVTADGLLVDIGANGELVTGTAPIVYHDLKITDASVTDFYTNKGTGGAPILVGDPFLPGTTAPGFTDLTFRPMPNRLMNLEADGLYTFRIVTGSDVVQGVIHDLVAYLGAQPVSERVDDAVIAAAGTTRLPLTKAYRTISNVVVTLQDDGGTAVRAKVFDKSITGPLVKCYDTTNALDDGTVDAVITGY